MRVPVTKRVSRISKSVLEGLRPQQKDKIRTDCMHYYGLDARKISHGKVHLEKAVGEAPSKWVPRGTPNRSKIHKNRYLDTKVPHWVAHGIPGLPKWYPEGARVVPQGAKRGPQGASKAPKRQVWVPKASR